MSAQLFSWQEEGAAFLAKRNAAILALAPGLGKTATAIRGAELAGVKSALVVVPLTLMATWRNEINKWSSGYASLRVIHGSRLVHKQVGRSPEGIRWIVTNYNTITDGTVKGNFDLVIADESVLLKNPKRLKAGGVFKTKRVEAMRKLRSQAKRYWLLSGSPTTKWLDDLWAQLHIIAPDVFRGYWKFAMKYCTVVQDQWGWRIIGNKEQAYRLLKFDLRDFMYAKSQSDVADIPDWIEETIETPMEPEQWEQYRAIQEDALLDLPDGDQLVAPNVLAKMTRMLQLASNPILVGGHNLSSKWDALKEMLEYVPGPTIIWTAYIKTADELGKLLNAPTLTGATPLAKRQEIVDAFQDGKYPVIIAHPGVGKYGLTLTKARSAIYLERTFDGDAYIQSMYRTRRIGTVEPPYVYRLLATSPEGKPTIDHVVDAVLNRKADGSGTLVGVRYNDFAILKG